MKQAGATLAWSTLSLPVEEEGISRLVALVHGASSPIKAGNMLTKTMGRFCRAESDLLSVEKTHVGVDSKYHI